MDFMPSETRDRQRRSWKLLAGLYTENTLAGCYALYQAAERYAQERPDVTVRLLDRSTDWVEWLTDIPWMWLAQLAWQEKFTSPIVIGAPQKYWLPFDFLSKEDVQQFLARHINEQSPSQGCGR